jgi:tetratricopeptide (TPR) repeat protein
MNRWLKSTFVGIGAMLFISGCAKSSGSATPVMLRELARSYLIGTTYDQALMAAQQDNQRALRDRLNRLDELNATAISSDLQLIQAGDLVHEAIGLDIKSQTIKSQNPALSQQLQGQAGQKYRSALRWSPQFPSDDPLLLKALGYYLADRGRSNADFELAAELTNRAIVLLQKTMDDNKNIGVSGRKWLSEMRQQQAITRDSYAWALYKLKRYEEAEAAQRAALIEADSSGLKDHGARAELQAHLAKILKAEGK